MRSDVVKLLFRQAGPGGPGVPTSSGWAGSAPSNTSVQPADLAGVTSRACCLDLNDASYFCQLHFFILRRWICTVCPNCGGKPSSVCSVASCCGFRGGWWFWSMASNGPREIVHRCAYSDAFERDEAA
jgi:hypothetical protein